jgi:hypothetical protein
MSKMLAADFFPVGHLSDGAESQQRHVQTAAPMSEHKLLYYPYASFTNAQLPLLKVAALWFDKLVILDSVGA